MADPFYEEQFKGIPAPQQGAAKKPSTFGPQASAPVSQLQNDAATAFEELEGLTKRIFPRPPAWGDSLFTSPEDRDQVLGGLDRLLGRAGRALTPGPTARIPPPNPVFGYAPSMRPLPMPQSLPQPLPSPDSRDPNTFMDRSMYRNPDGSKPTVSDPNYSRYIEAAGLRADYESRTPSELERFNKSLARQVPEDAVETLAAGVATAIPTAVGLALNQLPDNKQGKFGKISQYCTMLQSLELINIRNG